MMAESTPAFWSEVVRINLTEGHSDFFVECETIVENASAACQSSAKPTDLSLPFFLLHLREANPTSDFLYECRFAVESLDRIAFPGSWNSFSQDLRTEIRSLASGNTNRFASIPCLSFDSTDELAFVIMDRGDGGNHVDAQPAKIVGPLVFKKLTPDEQTPYFLYRLEEIRSQRSAIDGEISKLSPTQQQQLREKLETDAVSVDDYRLVSSPIPINNAADNMKSKHPEEDEMLQAGPSCSYSRASFESESILSGSMSDVSEASISTSLSKLSADKPYDPNLPEACVVCPAKDRVLFDNRDAKEDHVLEHIEQDLAQQRLSRPPVLAMCDAERFNLMADYWQRCFPDPPEDNDDMDSNISAPTSASAIVSSINPNAGRMNASGERSNEQQLTPRDASFEGSASSMMVDDRIGIDFIDVIPSIPCSYCGERVAQVPSEQEAHAVKHHTHFKCLHCNATMDTEAKLIAACRIAHPAAPCQPSEEEMFEMRLLDIVAGLYFSPAYYAYLQKYEPETLSPRNSVDFLETGSMTSLSGPGPDRLGFASDADMSDDEPFL